MDAIGTLEISWAQGYNGGKAAYVDKDVICYQCGNNVKFVAEDGAETIFNFKGNGVGPFAVHPNNKCFAVTENCLNPKIFVYVYPTFRESSVLQDGAKLEYSSIVFSNSEYLASISGIPEFELTLWKYVDGSKLCSVKVSAEPITCMTFNPGNWRQICISTAKSITMWNVEQSNEKFMFLPQKVKLPAEDALMNMDDEKDRDVPTRASTRMTRYTIDVPKAAIAGLVGESAEELDEVQDETPRVVPSSHTWAPSGDVFVGCKGGHILRIDGEVYKAKVLYYPPPRAATPNSRATSATSRYNSQADIQAFEDTRKMILEGGANCIALHRKGLYVAGQDGILRLINLKSEELNVTEQVTVGLPISSLSFSPSYRHITMGTTQGSLHLYEPGAPESLQQLKDTHWGNFIGIGCLPGNEYCVSVREDGEVQVWTIDKGLLVSSIAVGMQATCLACSPMLHVAAIGTVSGNVCYVDLSFPKKPRVVFANRLYQGPVTNLVYEMDGKFLVAGSDNGHVFVINGKASQQFKPIGYTTVSGEIQSISCYTQGLTTKIAVSANSSGNKRNGADLLLHFEISDEIVHDVRKHVHSLKYDFIDASVKKMELRLALPSYGASLAEGNMLFSMSQKTKKLNQIPLPEEPPKKSEREPDEESLDDHEALMVLGKGEPLYPENEYISHQLPGGKLQLSPHGKWLASCGTDGSVMIRSIGSLERFLVIHPHAHHIGGVKLVSFAEDAQNIFTTGNDGVLACYMWNFTSTGIGKAKSAMEAARARKSRLMTLQKEEDEVIRNMAEWAPPSLSRPPSEQMDQAEKERMAMEKARESDEIYRTPTPVAPADATWLQVQELEAVKEEDNKFSGTKTELRVNIRDMRRTIQEMLRHNETLPEIEKLGRHEFDLDIEEQNRLQSEADAEVQRVREEIEFDNLAKIYLREMIKRECWDDMKVKGRSIQAFFSTLEVSNFPMRERSAAYQKELDTISARRRIQLAELATRKSEVDALQKPTTTAQFLSMIQQQGYGDDDLGDNEEGDESGKEKPATTGSLGALYGGGSELFYSQFELHTRQQKTAQIILLEDAIYRIKNIFNKEFDEVYQKKISEIGKIKDKNKRIKKILEDLELNEDLIEPILSIYEEPEVLLKVEDHEIKVEKYLTPEQRKAYEKKMKEEEERRLREKGDNARERGLDMMMGGVLEIKKEDELKKDIAKPIFMTTKEPTDWTEDEQKAAKEYERKVKELQEEREKYRKQLETELRKQQSLIQDGMQAFDEALNQLFMKKIKIMMVIYQEELKILRLRYTLLIEEELVTREKELNRMLEHKKNLKAMTANAVIESKKNLDAFREQYDILNAEDKVMDRSFKREFHDVSAVQQDQLYRLFRKRPRIPRLKGFDTSAPPATADSSLPNPFADRPSTARQHAQAKSQLDYAIAELDKDINIPEGVELPVWQRLCRYRREKIENDLLIKQKALVLAEMESFLKKRMDEDEQLKNEIEGLFDTLNKLKEDSLRFNLNLEIQLLLKQGQVEVDATNFIHDYKDSALIHRSVVEELNSNIKQLGESKIASMVESKDFRKGIIQLEWEQKRMLMQMEDLQNKMKDIQFMKVTREIQLFLSNEDYEGRKAEEIGKLEQTILTQLKHHEKLVREKKRMLKELNRTIKSKSGENFSMDNDLTDINVTVNERRHINEVNADRRSNTGTEQRYQEIVQRRKLVDLAKAQAQEVAVLRAEVERLRMRTFPALVQVEH